MPFLTVCLNPTLQKTLRFPSVVPGTVNRTSDHRLDVSGKGINVSRVLTQLGKSAVHLTQLGGVMRPLFLSLCEQDGLSIDWVESNSQIRFCYTMITENGVTELVEESEPVGAGTEERLAECFDSNLSKLTDPSVSLNRSPCKLISCLIISGTKAAGFSDMLIPSMVRKAKEKGLKVILDIKGNDLIESLQYEPDIIKPNLYEFVATFAPHLVKDNDVTADDTQIKTSAMDICNKYRCGVILTDGSRKIRAADSDSFLECDIKAAKAVNTTGCGDAFTAGLASALEECKGFREAITEGIRCGALNAAQIKPGVIR